MNRHSASWPGRRSCGAAAVRTAPEHPAGGFTLFEVLLVAFIVMLTASFAVPAFVRSYEGAKLRTSARTILMSHRYARSTAVLKQKQVAVLFDSALNSIEIVSLQADNTEGLTALPADIRGGGYASGAIADEEDITYTVNRELTRPLAEGVQITHCRVDDKDQEEDGIYWINYQPSGMCDKYTIRLVDQKDNAVRIDIDPLSGSANIEYD